MPKRLPYPQPIKIVQICHPDEEACLRAWRIVFKYLVEWMEQQAELKAQKNEVAKAS